MSASTSSTRFSELASATAKLAAVQLLPSPGRVEVITTLRHIDVWGREQHVGAKPSVCLHHLRGATLSGVLWPGDQRKMVELRNYAKAWERETIANVVGGVEALVKVLNQSGKADRHE